MGCRIGQDARPTHHPRTGEQDPAKIEARQFNQQLDSSLSETERSLMKTPDPREQQERKIRTQPGFLAALDQSGGSTPKALMSYGLKESDWSNEEEMFTRVHEMRVRIVTTPSFNGDRILGAILFEGTMDRDVEGQPAADYLW